MHENRSDAIEAIHTRLDVVSGDFPELVRRDDVRGQAVANDGKNSEGEPVCLYFSCWRQLRLQAGDDGVDALQRQNHVAAPVEEKIDLGGTAAGDGLNFLQTWDAVDGFLERARDDHEHLVDGHHAVVDADNHAGKIGVGKNGHRDGEREIGADEHQADG